MTHDNSTTDDERLKELEATFEEIKRIALTDKPQIGRPGCKIFDMQLVPHYHYPGTCPNCGYCPHCGRGGYAQPWYPQPWYPQWPTINWTSTIPVTTTTGPW